MLPRLVGESGYRPVRQTLELNMSRAARELAQAAAGPKHIC
jgi:hypothetical protein